MNYFKLMVKIGDIYEPWNRGYNNVTDEKCYKEIEKMILNNIKKEADDEK